MEAQVVDQTSRLGITHVALVETVEEVHDSQQRQDPQIKLPHDAPLGDGVDALRRREVRDLDLGVVGPNGRGIRIRRHGHGRLEPALDLCVVV